MGGGWRFNDEFDLIVFFSFLFVLMLFWWEESCWLFYLPRYKTSLRKLINFIHSVIEQGNCSCGWTRISDNLLWLKCSVSGKQPITEPIQSLPERFPFNLRLCCISCHLLATFLFKGRTATSNRSYPQLISLPTIMRSTLSTRTPTRTILSHIWIQERIQQVLIWDNISE